MTHEKNKPTEVVTTKLHREVYTNQLNSREVVSIINRAYTYHREVITYETPKKFLTNKTYSKEDYLKDLKTLRNFDINLLWDKSFWGLSYGESVCAIATEPYTKLKVVLYQVEKNQLIK